MELTAKQESEQTLREMLYELGHEDVALEDFGLKGDETNKQLQEMAHDFDSEIQSDKAEAAATRSARFDAAEEEEAYMREIYG